MLLDIRHETTYHYAAPVSYSLQYMRLWPRADGGQRVLHWRVDAPGRRWMQTDAYGNTVLVSSLVERHHEIHVVARGQVETLDARGVLLPHDSQVPPLAFALPTRLTEANSLIEELTACVLQDLNPAELNSPEALQPLVDAVFQRVSYVQGVTDVSHTAAEVMHQGQGVCQDMTHVFLACCRAHGIAARYVSGYLLTHATHAASHAWAEAWLPGARGNQGAWVGFDVTHQRLAGPELCRLAVGRDYADASPLRGIHMGGAGEALSVKVAVQGADQ